MHMPAPCGSRSLSHCVPPVHSPPFFVHGSPMPLQFPAVGGHAIPAGGSHAPLSPPSSPASPDAPESPDDPDDPDEPEEPEDPDDPDEPDDPDDPPSCSPVAGTLGDDDDEQ